MSSRVTVKLFQLIQISLAVLFAIIVIGYFEGHKKFLFPFVNGAPGPTDAIQIFPGKEKTKPLHAQIVLIPKSERKRLLLNQEPFASNPTLLTLDMINNPLIVNSCCACVNVENTTDHPIQLLDSAKLFSTVTEIRDAKRGLVPRYISRRMRDGAKNSLKTILEKKARILKPGEVIKVQLSLFGHELDGEFSPKPGVYSIRALADSLTFPDVDLLSVKSGPFRVRVDEHHIKEWRKIFAD